MLTVPTDKTIVKVLRENDVAFDSKGTGSSAWWTIIGSLLPFILLFGFWIFLMNQVQGGGSKGMAFGKSRACGRSAVDFPRNCSDLSG